MDSAGDEVDAGAAGRPASRRDLADLSEAVRDLDRRIELHLARLRKEREDRLAMPDPDADDGIPGQRLRPSG